MNDAAHLRAQKRTSTDPEWLEREARLIEDAIRGDDPKPVFMARPSTMIIAAMLLIGAWLIVLYYKPALAQNPCGPQSMETWGAPRLALPDLPSAPRRDPEAIMVIDGTVNRY